MTKTNHNDYLNTVGAIVGSYHEESKILHINAGKLPNRDVIIDVIHQLRALLFPGYFGEQNIPEMSVEYHVGSLLIDIHFKLVDQIKHALVYQATRGKRAIANERSKAETILHKFFREIPALRAVLATDVQAAFNGDPSATDTDEVIISFPGVFAITVYRLAHTLHLLKVPLIPRIMSEYAHSVTGIDIHPGATIGESFFIDHGTGVVIGETTHIGKGVKVYQGVTLGAVSTRGGQKLKGVKRHPTLEDEVTVYSGASILGGETVIGKGVVISSNVFVTKSVPALTRVTVKNPELQYRDQTPTEFKQDTPFDWTI